MKTQDSIKSRQIKTSFIDASPKMSTEISSNEISIVRSWLLLPLLAMFVAFGCAKSNYNSDSATVPAVVAPIAGTTISSTPTYGSVTYTGGSTVQFIPEGYPGSLTTMSSYVAAHALNAPTNVRINVNLTQAGAGRYGGAVSISYMDNGLPYEGVFTAGTGVNQYHKDLLDNGKYEAEYNYWFNYNGTSVFSGFFQEVYNGRALGSIVIVISPDTTSGTNTGDGVGTVRKYAGKVYYKNFPGDYTSTLAPTSSMRSCWFTYNGPNDCRSNIVQTKCGLYPEAGYKYLGSFTGLDLAKAFNM